jgi:hypothetical protein
MKSAIINHVAGPYLIRFAQEAAWREDHRKEPNGFQVDRQIGLASTTNLASISADIGSGAANRLTAACQSRYPSQCHQNY